MATQTVQQFMKTNNRPYSANDIAQALKELNKSAIQKALDQLVSKGVLRVKEYGKQKVYCAVQKDSLSSDDEDDGDIDSLILQAQGELDQLKKELSCAETKLKNFMSSKTTEEAARENETLQDEIEQLKLKLLSFEKSENTLTDTEMKELQKKWDSSVKEYRKRKRVVTDILDQILEGYPKTKKHLIEEIGIEDDESANMPKIEFSARSFCR